MNQTPSKTRNQQEASDYELRVQGHLGARWAAHLDAARLVNELDGTTTLLVRVLDQAALHGCWERSETSACPSSRSPPSAPNRADSVPIEPGSRSPTTKGTAMTTQTQTTATRISGISRLWRWYLKAEPETRAPNGFKQKRSLLIAKACCFYITFVSAIERRFSTPGARPRHIHRRRWRRTSVRLGALRADSSSTPKHRTALVLFPTSNAKTKASLLGMLQRASLSADLHRHRHRQPPWR